MKSICPEIDIVIKLALDDGNRVKEVSEGWSKAKQVFFMEKNLTYELKNKIEAQMPKLEYWKDPGSPHNEPDEGFFCNECTVGISFPVARRVVR